MSPACPGAPPGFPRSDVPLVIAHGDERGSGLYPGNTLLYLEKMVALGVDALEIDVNLSADGQLVLNHDPNLERTSDGRGAVGEHSLAELRKLNMAYHWSRDGRQFPYRDDPLSIATIEEAFATLPHTPMIIELKNDSPRAAEALCESIRRFRRQEWVIVSSFHQKVIEHFRRLCPEVVTGAATVDALKLYSAQLFGTEQWLQPGYGAMQLPVRYFGLPVFTRRFVRAARRLGLHLSVWTVDECEDMQRYIDLGLDGIVTNRPDRLLSLLES